MDTQLAMDKKAMAKAPPLPSKNGSEGTLKGKEGGNARSLFTFSGGGRLQLHAVAK